MLAIRTSALLRSSFALHCFSRLAYMNSHEAYCMTSLKWNHVWRAVTYKLNICDNFNQTKLCHMVFDKKELLVNITENSRNYQFHGDANDVFRKERKKLNSSIVLFSHRKSSDADFRFKNLRWVRIWSPFWIPAPSGELLRKATFAKCCTSSKLGIETASLFEVLGMEKCWLLLFEF